MKSVNSALRTLLRTRQFFWADLYEFALSNGTFLRYTTGDSDIAFNGSVYSAGGKTGALIGRDGDGSRLQQRLGLEVTSLEFQITPRAGTVAGLPFTTAARGGLFDGARLTVYRAFTPSYGDTSVVGAINIFVGDAGPLDVRGSHIRLSFNSVAARLSTSLPKNIYSPTCINALGDANCGVDLEGFSQDGTVASGSDADTVVGTITGPPNRPAGYYDLGRLKMTSGSLAGLSRPIKVHTISPITFELWSEFPAVPAIGQTFRVYPGCKKLLTDPNGCPKFGNQANFRGQPYVPAPETVA